MTTPDPESSVFGGTATGVLAGLAVELCKNWNEERKSRQQIIRLFRSACVTEDQEIRSDCESFTINGLTFSWSAPQPNGDGDVYREVQVLKEDAAGDDPKRVRIFRFYLGENNAHFLKKFFADKPEKGSCSWPPHGLYYSQPERP